MKHPNPKIQENQEDFLNRCPDDEKAFHARLFRIGNASYRYHQLAASANGADMEKYYHEWLEGLPDNVRAAMKERGFENCKTALPFTRYVNEREDIGMDTWMKEHLSEEDYKAYRSETKI